MKFGVIVHGGAGDIPSKLEHQHLDGVTEACEIAFNILKSGGTAIDAAEASVISLENNQVFDAGSGSFFNELGEIEMDAMIATDAKDIGSVCAIKNVKNPIQVARLVLEKTNHVMLVGDGALNFAISQGIQEISQDELGISPELILRYQTDDFTKMMKFSKKFGTVGCVCLDQTGHFALATSTGGSAMKKQGRVGDTALWGAGGYVNDFGAAAATGLGEDLIRVLFTHSAVKFLERNKTTQEAAQKSIELLKSKVGSDGGIIVINRDGFGYSFNTKKMSVAYRNNMMEKVQAFIK